MWSSQMNMHDILIVTFWEFLVDGILFYDKKSIRSILHIKYSKVSTASNIL